MSRDTILWDSTAVMDRAGEFAGEYRRDMRRTTVHDSSSQAWGLNAKDTPAQGFVLYGGPAAMMACSPSDVGCEV